jgi:hypothetical protein
MDIVKELKEYKLNKAKLNGYRLELSSLENYRFEEIKESKNEVIEGLSLRKSDSEAISTSSLESKLEKIALNYSKELNRQISQKDVVENRTAQIKSIVFYLELKVEYISKVVLACLSNKEKFVIEQQVIENMNWNNVKFSYNEFYREQMEIEGLKTMRRNAIDKIKKVIQETESCILWRGE